MEMESNLSIIAKKYWHLIMYMLKKGISKRKLLADLNMMMKRGKIVRKAIHNLMFHHGHAHHGDSSSATSALSHRSHDHHLSFTPHPDEYEFSCSNSPAYPGFRLPFHLNKRKNKNHHHAPPSEDESITANAIMKALEMLQSATASPALPGFGKSPMVRKLRITDSPFPLRDVDEDSHVVDEACEQFIAKFYKDLRKQNAKI